MHAFPQAYRIVTAERQHEKHVQTRMASHAFTRRWQTLVQGMGAAAAAAVEAAGRVGSGGGGGDAQTAGPASTMKEEGCGLGAAPSEASLGSMGGASKGASSRQQQKPWRESASARSSFARTASAADGSARSAPLLLRGSSAAEPSPAQADMAAQQLTLQQRQGGRFGGGCPNEGSQMICRQRFGGPHA
jgi:hypothetical protein